MSIKNVLPIEKGLINVIIETPKNSRDKYDYDEKLELFRQNKTMPMGMVFPFDFGFIPNTKGDDGDPIDVLVISEQAGYPGCLVTCRVIGAMKAIQTERDKKKMRNDRIIAVNECSDLYKKIDKMPDLGKETANQIKNFFINYNMQAGKHFKPIGWEKPKAALELIKMHCINN